MNTCKTCGRRIDSRNTSGYCKHHHRAAHMPKPWEFVAIAEGKTASVVARKLDVHVTTVRDWANRYGVTLARGFYGRPATKKPTPVINDRAALKVIDIAPQPAPAPCKSWCAQCDRMVFSAEAAACRSQFCKAKVAA